MQLHRNAKLGLSGRFALVRAIEAGCSIREAARRHGVSPATACEWWRRWHDASPAERESRACLHDRSSRPHRCPRMLTLAEQERICEKRRRTGWGPRLLAGELGHPHSTVSKTLQRNGCSRPDPSPREPANRYEWPCPGDLLHMDSSSYARFERPGHRVTGDRSQSLRGRSVETRVGYDFAHAVVDDHSRLAYAELLPDERALTVVAFTKRALAFFARHGIKTKRLMTDNAWCYTHSRAFRSLLSEQKIKHLTIEPYRPRTNGKVERFHQTMAREWAYGVSNRNSQDRAAALPHWLHHYNTTRPHSSHASRPPISRVRNLCGQDN